MAENEIIRAIKYRLNHPEEVPSKSWWAVYRQDIQTLLEELENERNKAEREKETDARDFD